MLDVFNQSQSNFVIPMNSKSNHSDHKQKVSDSQLLINWLRIQCWAWCCVSVIKTLVTVCVCRTHHVLKKRENSDTWKFLEILILQIRIQASYSHMVPVTLVHISKSRASLKHWIAEAIVCMLAGPFMLTFGLATCLHAVWQGTLYRVPATPVHHVVLFILF